MSCFAIARYPLAICIVLGLIGGLAGGMLSKWWQLTSDPEPVKKEKESRLPKAVENIRKQLRSLGVERQAKQSRRHHHQYRRHYQQPPRMGLFGRPRVQSKRSLRRQAREQQKADDSSNE